MEATLARVLAFDTGKQTKVLCMAVELAKDLRHQVEHARRIREYAYRILEGEHKNDFQRKDYIGFALFNRCLQTHKATEILVRDSLLDDANPCDF